MIYVMQFSSTESQNTASKNSYLTHSQQKLQIFSLRRIDLEVIFRFCPQRFNRYLSLWIESAGFCTRTGAPCVCIESLRSEMLELY